MTLLNRASDKKLSTQSSAKPKFKAASLMVGVITMAAASSLLVACGGSEHEVHAVDKVEEAAEMARANAPEPEDMKFEQTAVATTPSTETADATTAVTEGQSTGTDAETDTDTGSNTVTAVVAEQPVVPETIPVLTGDTAQAADAAAAAVQKAK